MALGAVGDLADGYHVMLLGKQKALEGAANSEPWAEELEFRWEHAIRRYVERCDDGRT